MDDWTPELAKVVAIQTKLYTRRKVAQGTRWGAVASVLWQKIPELHDELREHLPSQVIESLSKGKRHTTKKTAKNAAKKKVAKKVVGKRAAKRKSTKKKAARKS